MKLIIIGGVAGGASAAARARRLDENADIILIEKGEYISFANCGLPYHIGNVIQDRDNLLVMSPEDMKARANIDVRIRQKAIRIDPVSKTVTIEKSDPRETYTESYDKLILSTGSTPVIPPIPGADDPDVSVLWTINDMDKIIARIKGGARKVAVVGGGFIGLEIVENLIELGLEASLFELTPQVLPPFDREMAQPISETLASHGVNLHLSESVVKVEKLQTGNFRLNLKSGGSVEADILIFAAGIRPNSELAKDAGLKLNERGGIVVNEFMQTSSPDIFAIGDVAQVTDLATGRPAMIPLAGPANREGRVAADNVFGLKTRYKGSLGTAVCKIFELTAACTGASEKRLRQEKIEHIKFYLVPKSNASYYPGSKSLYIKVLADLEANILGAQIVGEKGVDKRIDVIASAIRNKLKLSDLEELELAYAPPYGSAKDPVNFIGFIGGNILSGRSSVVSPDTIPAEAFLLDVREPDENIMGSIPGSFNIPLGTIRNSLEKLPKDKLIVTYCQVGLRGYLAECILRANGFNVRNLSGGYSVWKLFNPKPLQVIKKQIPETVKKMESDPKSGSIVKLNVCGLQCPGPIMKVKEKLGSMAEEELLQAEADDMGFMKDVPAWCQATGNKLISVDNVNGKIIAVIQKGAGTGMQPASCALSSTAKGKKTAIVLFSNDLDKALAAMIISLGFTSLGHEVSVFFTFWGLNVLRRDNPPPVRKDLLSRMFGFMMPRGAKKLALSKMHMLGMGTQMMKHVMKMKNVDSLEDLMKQAQANGVKFLACEMAMNIMGIREEELIDGVERAGVATFTALSEQGSATLFI